MAFPQRIPAVTVSPPIGVAFLAVVASAQDPLVLPSDTILHPSWTAQGVSVEVRHEFDRTVVRPGIAWQDSVAGALLEVLDTSCVVRNPAPSRLDGQHGFHAALSAPLLAGTGTFSVLQLGQFEGQLSDSAGMAGSHMRGRLLGGWGRPWSAFRLGGWAGLQWERDDPAVGSLSLVPGEPAHEGVVAAGLFGIEAGWSVSEDDLPREIAAHLQRDQGDPELREESGDLRARWATRGSPFGRLQAEGVVDASRRRSELLGIDRDNVRREASLSWSLDAFGQSVALSPRVADTVMRDYSGRVPGENARGWGWRADLAGGLPAGFLHRQVLGWSRADREVLDVHGNRGDLEKSQSSANRVLELSDTLGWATGLAGGLSVRGGWLRSLWTSRHPENPDPGVSDRPDQDLSETGIGLVVRDSALARGEKPLFAWSWIGRDEVYLRSVRSAETRRVEGYRFAVDAAIRPARRILLEIGGNAREQRTTYRFDSTRDAGLMEVQWDAAVQEGPANRPNARLWVEQRWTWLGGLVGDDFAVGNRTVLWKPGARVWWRMGKVWTLSPWMEYWLESSRSWDGARLAEDPRQTEWRVALDLGAMHGERGSADLSLQRIVADPGSDDWRLKGEGRWTW